MRKSIFMLIYILTLSLLLCGCSNKDDVYFVKNNIFMDKVVTSESKEIGFNLACIYKGNKHPEIKINSVNGDNTGAVVASCKLLIDPTSKKVKYKKYKYVGVYVTIDISALDGGDMVKIESIDFNVNGTNKCYVFESPLCVEVVEEPPVIFEDTDSILVTYFDEEYDSKWEAKADVVVEDVGFCKNLKMNNFKIYKATGRTDNEIDNKVEVQLPVELKKGEVMILSGEAAQGEFLNYQHLYDSLVISCQLDNSDKTYKVIQGITVLGGYDGDDMEDVTKQKNLEHIVDNELLE